MKFPCPKAEGITKINKGSETVLGALFSSWSCKCVCSAPNYSCTAIPTVTNKKFNDLDWRNIIGVCLEASELLQNSFWTTMCYCLNLILGKELDPWATSRETQREKFFRPMEQRAGSSMEREDCSEQARIIWHNALDRGGNSLLSWESVTSLDLHTEKSGSSGKELADGWISWRLSLSILTILSICENGIVCNFTKRTTLLLCGAITTENRYCLVS